MHVWLWALVLIVTAWGAHWNAKQLVKPLKKSQGKVGDDFFSRRRFSHYCDCQF